MRKTTILLLATLSACAAQQRRTNVLEAKGRYECGDVVLHRDGERLTASVDAHRGSLTPTPLSWSDDDGDHFVSFPNAVTDVETVEYLLPHDPRADAIERRFDTSKGSSTADWRLTQQRSCRACGGYSDAFARWASGSSLDDITASLSLESRAEARALVHRALLSFNKRYYGAD